MSLKNEAAFPRSSSVSSMSGRIIDDSQVGLTKRELIAMLVTHAVVASGETAVGVDAIAVFAVKQADQLLRRLEESK